MASISEDFILHCSHEMSMQYVCDVNVHSGKRKFSVFQSVQMRSGTQPTYWMDAGGKAVTSVKIVWAYTSTPPHTFMAWCFIIHWANLLLHKIMISLSA